MRKGLMTALLFTMAMAGPAVAQNDDSQSTATTQDSSDDNAPLWNLLGLAGVLGVMGLWRSTDNDGYTEDTSEFQ